MIRILTGDEISLLLFFETCLVDQSGNVGIRHMNVEDSGIAKRWTEEGFVDFKRRPMKDINGSTSTHKIWFSEDALDTVYHYRKERAKRHNKKEDKNEQSV